MSDHGEIRNRLKGEKPSSGSCSEVRVIKEPSAVFHQKTSLVRERYAWRDSDHPQAPYSEDASDTFPTGDPTPGKDAGPPAEHVLNEKLARYKDQVQALALELAKVEERELQRIASDLHDRIGQMLFAAKSKLERVVMKESALKVVTPLKETLDLVNQALLDTRELIVEISPPELYVFGLETAVTSLLDQIKTDYGISGTFRQMGRPLPLSEALNGVLYRAVRELIINVVKHAEAACIQVEIQYRGEAVVVTIEDDGRGFQSAGRPLESAPRDGYGLFSLKERLGFMGGRLEINTIKDQGTRAVIVLPVGHIPGPSATE